MSNASNDEQFGLLPACCLRYNGELVLIEFPGDRIDRKYYANAHYERDGGTNHRLSFCQVNGSIIPAASNLGRR